jgi:hypothetical protein
VNNHEYPIGKRAKLLLGGTREVCVLRNDKTIKGVVEHHLQEYMAVPFFWEFEPKEVPPLLYCVELMAIDELESFGFEVKFFLERLSLLNCKSYEGVSKVILRGNR